METHSIPFSKKSLKVAQNYFATAKQRKRKSPVPYGLRVIQHANSLSESVIMDRLRITNLSFDTNTKVMTVRVTA